jgi:predicted metal-dependent hydrolase
MSKVSLSVLSIFVLCPCPLATFRIEFFLKKHRTSIRKKKDKFSENENYEEGGGGGGGHA